MYTTPKMMAALVKFQSPKGRLQTLLTHARKCKHLISFNPQRGGYKPSFSVRVILRVIFVSIPKGEATNE